MEFPDPKIGEVVINNGKYARRISRITKTQIVIDEPRTIDGTYEKKYKRDSGRLVGAGTWCVDFIRYPKEGELDTLLEKSKRRKLVRVISEYDLYLLSDKELNEIAGILERNEN
jgi:hypothetical protein